MRGADVITTSDAIKTELMRNSNVLGVSWANTMMGGDFGVSVIGLENNDGVCIFIACLGLFGVAAFTAAQRTREIGLRKVLGARTGQIIGLLAHRIVWLVLAASAFASALAYAAMRAWLENFAFRIDVSPLSFVLAALAGLGIAYLTVALQSMKAARAHPVKALRHE